MELSPKYAAVIQLIDAANAADPVSIEYQGTSCPKEVVYAEKHLEWVLALDPDASECLRIAARAQHICRWEIPRSDYPMNRISYLRWREDLKKFHAQRAGELMEQVGYEDVDVDAVQALNLKKNLSKDTECQTLEDALCLTFLELGFDDLIARHDETKILGVVKKTAAKMSDAGRALIGTISFSKAGQNILDQL
jgi:hypothetical protein